MLLLCTSPFLYAFNRTAIIEPLLICLTLLALLTASHLNLSSRSSKTLSSRSAAGRGPALPHAPTELSSRPKAAHLAAAVGTPTVKLLRALPTIALGLLLPTIVLTKTTGICLFPAIFYLIWARAGYRLRLTLRLSILPISIAATTWLTYLHPSSPTAI